MLVVVSFSFSQNNTGIWLVGTMEATKSMDPSEEISWRPLDVVSFARISEAEK